jgi:hypothetical protein
LFHGIGATDCLAPLSPHGRPFIEKFPANSDDFRRRGAFCGRSAMKRGSELVTDAVEMLTQAGARPHVVRSGGKHTKICWLDRHGRDCVLIVPCTPSDKRARANAGATLRRLLRRSGATKGLLTEPD